MRSIISTLAVSLAVASVNAAVRIVRHDQDVRAVNHRQLRREANHAERHGFRLAAAYVQSRDNPAEIHQYGELPHARPRSGRSLQDVGFPDLHDADGSVLNARQRVQLLAQMLPSAFSEYDFDLTSVSAYDAIYQADQVPWGSFADTAEETAFRSGNAANIRSQAAADGRDPTNIGMGENMDYSHDDAATELGVAATVWMDGNTTIVHFRGSSSDLDFYNFRFMEGFFLIERSRDKYMTLWEEQAGQETTSAQRDRQTWLDELIYDNTAQAEFTLRANSVRSSLESLVEDAAVTDNDSRFDLVDNADIDLRGQFALTRAIIRDIVPEDGNAPATDELIISGYSQGGMRAQLASMLLAAEDGTRYETITFGATGTQCMVRMNTLHWDPFSSSTVDTQDDHSDHITSYHDVLDPYAAVDYNVGNVCYYGSSDIASRDALAYCEKLVGESLVSTQMPTEGSLNTDLRRCVYLTHGSLAIIDSLNDTNHAYLHLNGSTDGGCQPVPIIPVDDPDGLCPTGEGSGTFEIFVVVLVIIIIGGIIALFCITLAVWLAIMACCYQTCCSCCVDPNAGDGMRKVCCGLCSVPYRFSVFPECCCFCNRAPNPLSQTTAGCCNRCCCCCGAPCKFCGWPCCPPGPNLEKQRKDAAQSQPGGALAGGSAIPYAH